MRETLALFPERARVDVEALATHDADLALERGVVEVFGDRRLDREVDGVAPATGQAQWPRRRLGAAAAAAAVLLAHVLLEHEHA
ncbi:MAG: hypothetical protein JWN04_6608, partial [Myxococcaceae bacterium]|nr:hypothetical protein [Myxococcaceae bacterium]